MPTTRLARQALLASLLALTLVNAPAAAHATPPDAAQEDDVLFGVDKFAAGAKESNEVTLDKNMLGMAGGFLPPNLHLFAHNMDSVLIREYDYAAPGAYKVSDVEEVRKRLEGNGWKHLVRTRETSAQGTELTDICVRGDNDGAIRDMVIISAEPTEVSFIHLKGHLNAQDLFLLGSSLGVSAGELKLQPRAPQTAPPAPPQP